MKLKVTSHAKYTFEKNVQTLSENCTLGEAFITIENWCKEHDLQLPSLKDIWNNGTCVRVRALSSNKQIIYLFTIDG